MMNKPNYSSLLLVILLHAIVDGVVGVIVSLFILQQYSFGTVIEFRIFESLVVPFMAILVGFIVDRINPKSSLLIGVGLLILLLVGFVISVQTPISLWILAIISGSSAAARFFSLNILIQRVVSEVDQVVFFAQADRIWKVTMVLLPLISGIIIVSFGYLPVFVFGISVGLLLVYFCTKIPLVNSHNPFLIGKVVSILKKSRRSIIETNGLWGIESSFLVIVMPLLIISVVQSELWWGVLATLTGLIGVIFSIFLQRKPSEVLPSVLAILSLLISGIVISYVNQPSFIWFLLLVTMTQLWQTGQNVGLKPLLNRIIQTENIAFQTEANIIAEMSYAFGKLLMLILIWLLAPVISQPLVVGLVFLLVSLIPIYEVRAVASEALTLRDSTKLASKVKSKPLELSADDRVIYDTFF